MAFGLPDRHRNRTLYSHHEALDSGKPALADDPRFRQGSRGGRARDSSAFFGRSMREHERKAARAAARALTYAARGGGTHLVHDLSAAHARRPLADGRASLLL